jgi:hypothetical protein
MKEVGLRKGYFNESNMTKMSKEPQVLLDADPVRGKGYFWEKKHERKKGQLEGKATHVRESCETCMQGIPNDVRVRVFAMYCNG